MPTYWSLLVVTIGFLLGGLSAFTTYFARRLGERTGKLVTAVLRNLLAIPTWMAGFVWAWSETPRIHFSGDHPAAVVGGLLILGGFTLGVVAHVQLGMPTHLPTVKDSLYREGLYARVRHPIYAGGMLVFIGLAAVRPSPSLAAAAAVGLLWCLVQARLEEVDLVQRLPAYHSYMREVPRFLPRITR